MRETDVFDTAVSTRQWRKNTVKRFVFSHLDWTIATQYGRHHGESVSLPAAEPRHFRTIYVVCLVNLCFRLCKRSANTSSIAFYRLNQPSLRPTIFVPRCLSFFLTQKQSSYDDYNFITRMLFYDIYYFDCQSHLNNFSAWLSISLFHYAVCHMW